MSGCTCPGEDHPGPNVGVGRGAPESEFCSSFFGAEVKLMRFVRVVDIIEGQVDCTFFFFFWRGFVGGRDADKEGVCRSRNWFG